MKAPSDSGPPQTSTPAPQAQPQTAEAPGPIDWNGWLETVRALPSEAPDWEGIPEFLETLDQLYRHNQQERQHREDLQKALNALTTQAEGRLAYFGMQAVSRWTAESCPPIHITEAVQLSKKFLSLLLKHQEDEQQRLPTLDEDRLRRQKVDKLEGEIEEIYKDLTELFTSPPEQPSQKQTKEEEHQAKAEPPRPASKPSSDTLDEPSPLSQPEEVLPQEDRAFLPETETEAPDSQGDKLAPSTAPKPAPSEPRPPVSDPPSPQSRKPQEKGESAPTSPETGEGRSEESLSNDPHPSALYPKQIDYSGVPSTSQGPSSVIKPAVPPSGIFLPGIENPAIQTIATQLQASPEQQDWTRFLWALIAGDDLPTAYWLARALSAMEQPCPVPARLLAAIQAARWLLPDSQTFVNDLADIVQEDAQSFEDEPQKLLGLSAALRATLLAPSTGIQAWLGIPKSCPSLHDVVEAVKKFSTRRRSLRPDDLLGGTAVEQRKESLREATQKAKTWLEEAPKRRTKFQRASNVWRRMTARDGALRTLLLPVAKDDQIQLNEVLENLELWQDKTYIIAVITKIDRKRAGRRAREIDGAARDQIIRYVQEACGLARHWCECVERVQEIQNGRDSFSQMTNELRSQIQETLPEVIPALQELTSSDQPQSISAAAHCLRRSVEQLQDMFAGQPQPPTRQQEWFTGNADSLPTTLGRLLLWLPEISQEDDGQIVEADLLQVPLALCDAIVEGRSLQTAFDTWLDQQDYRFIETMLAAFDEADLPAKSRAYQDALEGSREGLRTAMSETRAAIERAEVNGISVEERSEHEGIIEAINPTETLYFSQKHDQLTQISAQLKEAGRIRLKEVQTDWDRLQPQLVNQIDPTKWERIQAFVQSNLDREQTRVVDECIAHLTEVVEEGGELKEELFSPPHSRHVLQEFLNTRLEIEDSLQRMNLRQVAKNIRNGSSVAGIKFGEIPGKRCDEAVQAIEAWRNLKQQRGNDSIIRESVATLLGYLGFSLKSKSDLSVHDPSTDWVHIRAQMSASDLAKPIPQFGSQTHGRYDIVCIWERPGADSMSARLRDLHLNTRSVLVFYLGRLTVRQRSDYTRRARNEELVIAVLDETLLVFLAQERDARLPIFLRCTLPFSAVNPYTPSGYVPPEMFFGRDQMVRELQRSSGSCLVYGGRQLGKSALLQHVRREFHHPEQERYAWVEDIKLLGDPQADSPPETLWGRVRDGLKELKLLPRSITTDKQEEVIRRVQKVMDERRDRHVLMLFDEADKFLDADAEERFQVVEGLRNLMLNTQRRFKVVFAGLHNVQRFQGIPNQPLAQFGTPLLVGPLELTAAQKLVHDPLEVLGYRFEDAGTVLRILSYTNYHPGLIQLFCHELLRHLRQQDASRQSDQTPTPVQDELLKHLRQQDVSPPYSIVQNNVEAVYLLSQVRNGIRERFDWTLALDSRYQTIVWAMVFDQIGTRGGYNQAYVPAELLRLARDAWSKGFNKVDSDQLRGLLDEMRGLGVLVRDANGYYRLRSPNLVRLVGTENDIYDRLAALSKEEPEQSFDADSHHALLDKQGQHYSPLTYAQGRQLNTAQFGVGLIFASDALGLAQIKEAFQRFIPADLPETKGNYQEIPPTVLSDTGLQQWLERYLGKYRNYERLILSCSFQSKQENLLETVRIARKVCQQHERSKKRWLRILFVFDPESTLNWLSLSHQQRQQLEEQVDVFTFPRRWNLSGLRQRLNQQNKIASEAVCRAILEATGGWPLLLEDLFDCCGRQDDPRPTVAAITKDLEDPHSKLSQKFKHSLGLRDIANRILKFIKTLQEDGQEVPVELIAPQNIKEVDGLPILSQEECNTAIEYLHRMGCIELQDDQLSVEPTVLRLV